MCPLCPLCLLCLVYRVGHFRFVAVLVQGIGKRCRASGRDFIVVQADISERFVDLQDIGKRRRAFVSDEIAIQVDFSERRVDLQGIGKSCRASVREGRPHNKTRGDIPNYGQFSLYVDESIRKHVNLSNTGHG